MSDSKKQSEVWSFIKTVCLFLLIFVFLRASVVEAFRIPSGSMIPTLRIGDYILVSKLSYGLRLPFEGGFAYQWGQPQRGDVVVFTRPDDPTTDEDESQTNLIKRVVGLPEETVELKGKRLYIDNQFIAEAYARYELGTISDGDFGPVKVPGGHVLMLGDNRDHSKDSRMWIRPYLDIQRIKGRALIVYWSWDSFTRIGSLIR